MKRTYTQTTTIKDLTKATFKLFISDKTKYEADLYDSIEIEYKKVKAWSIISGGKEAEEIEAHTDADGTDEFHEYLVLHFADGNEGTFRNSHVDMFIERR